MLPPFDHQPRTRLVFGPGTASRVGALAKDLGAEQILLVTDPGIVRAGHVDTVEQSLDETEIDFARYDEVRENPNSDDVEACLLLARGLRPDLIIGLGGGSSIDTAKGCNFLLTNGGTMEDFWGIGKAKAPLLPMIAVPTTAGTGTETQSFALIERAADHQKMACGDPSAAARIAVLDPQLTLSQPREITACTGLDTITHAVESFVTRKRNPVSSMYAREAFRLAHRNLPRVLEQGDDIDARGAMMLAAAFGGFAIENSMLGAAHSLANPLTAHVRLAHGEAVGTMLPFVVRFNATQPETATLYRELALDAGLCGLDTDADDAVETLIARSIELRRATGFASGLEERGVARDSLAALAGEASQQWTAQFNPRDVSEADLERLYEEALIAV